MGRTLDVTASIDLRVMYLSFLSLLVSKAYTPDFYNLEIFGHDQCPTVERFCLRILDQLLSCSCMAGVDIFHSWPSSIVCIYCDLMPLEHRELLASRIGK